MNSIKKDFTIAISVSIIIFSVIVGLFAWTIKDVKETNQRYEEQNHKVFEVWKKQTGNYRDLTYDEWKMLKDNHVLGNPPNYKYNY